MKFEAEEVREEGIITKQELLEEIKAVQSSLPKG
jgi:hypothetical protein